jgi:hypothetical protein
MTTIEAGFLAGISTGIFIILFSAGYSLAIMKLIKFCLKIVDRKYE